MTEIIREKRLISLNSNNATRYMNGSFLSDVTFDFKSILSAEDSIVYVEAGIQSGEIPITFYNIDYTNNIFNYTIDAVNYTITLRSGSYNYNTFVTEFLYQSNLNGHTFVCVLNRNSGILTLNLTAGGIAWTSILPSNIYYIIGLSSQSLAVTVTSNTYTFPQLFNLLGQKKLKIYSSNLAIDSYDSVGNATNNLICTMSINQPFFGMIVYNNVDGVYGHMKTNYLSTIDIQIKDELNNLINFNSINWTLTLVLILYKKLPPAISTIGKHQPQPQPQPDVVTLG